MTKIFQFYKVNLNFHLKVGKKSKSIITQNYTETSNFYRPRVLTWSASFLCSIIPYSWSMLHLVCAISALISLIMLCICYHGDKLPLFTGNHSHINNFQVSHLLKCLSAVCIRHLHDFNNNCK